LERIDDCFSQKEDNYLNYRVDLFEEIVRNDPLFEMERKVLEEDKGRKSPRGVSL
jgi:hypothetical protein